MTKLFRLKYVLVFIIGLILFCFSMDSFVFAQKSIKVPPSPENLIIWEVTDSSVTLSWDEPKNNKDIDTYKIYKNSTYIASTSDTRYVVNDLNSETEYRFYIRSEADNIVSLASNIVKVKTLSGGQILDNKIVGYYPAWKTYSGYTPDKIDASKLTHINYAFAYIGQDNKIKLGYPDIDPSNFKKLNDLKETNSNLKILISVGGWNWSGRFSDTASTQASREIFANSCVNLLKEYSLDGIDLDWEYPVGGGLSTNTRRPSDKENFTLLLREIRVKINEQGAKDNKEYLLTITGGASSYYLRNIEPTKIKEYVDFVNIMTYDLHGPWETVADFNAPLYARNYQISVDSSVKTWINLGFPKEKLVVGIPFYGYKYDVNKNDRNGLLQKFTSGEALSYSNIRTKYLDGNNFTKYFDEESMVPWLFNGKTFISYDDEQSIGLKAKYIKDQGLGGAMIWELSHDYNSELLDSIYKVLK